MIWSYIQTFSKELSWNHTPPFIKTLFGLPLCVGTSGLGLRGLSLYFLTMPSSRCLVYHYITASPHIPANQIPSYYQFQWIWPRWRRNLPKDFHPTPTIYVRHIAVIQLHLPVWRSDKSHADRHVWRTTVCVDIRYRPGGCALRCCRYSQNMHISVSRPFPSYFLFLSCLCNLGNIWRGTLHTGTCSWSYNSCRFLPYR